MQPAVKHFFFSHCALPGLCAVGRWFRPLLLAFFLLAALSFRAVPAAAAGQNVPPGSPRPRLEIIYSSSLFRTVSKNDALAALRVWTETVSRQEGLNADWNPSVAEDVAEIKRRLQEGPVGIVLLDPVEYFDLAGLGLLEPAYTGSRGADEESLQFLLVASQVSGVTTVSGLRGKTLAIQTNSRADLGRKWIEVLLHENGLGPADRFFSSLSSVSTPSEAVLPVFFGKLGAGVVDHASFEVMKEMNPQLGSRLRILAVSPPLLNGIVCVDKRLASDRAPVMKGLRELDQTAEGKQILLIFKANRLKPVNAEDLERVRTLCTKYRLLSGKTVASKTAAGPARAAETGGVRPEVEP
jgi:ABC-type phosphate/phosphonate transport system substrate-binding protein